MSHYYNHQVSAVHCAKYQPATATDSAPLTTAAPTAGHANPAAVVAATQDFRAEFEVLERAFGLQRGADPSMAHLDREELLYVAERLVASARRLVAPTAAAVSPAAPDPLLDAPGGVASPLTVAALQSHDGDYSSACEVRDELSPKVEHRVAMWSTDVE